MGKTTTAAVYCRISDDKKGAGLGVERQATCRQLAAERGFTVGRVYVDNDISAYSGKHRPEFERLLGDIRAGRVGAVLCWHTDRLYRRVADLTGYIRVTADAKVPTYGVTSGPLDLTTAAGRMQAVTFANMSEYEVAHRGERIAEKHTASAKAGLYRGGSARPFGYRAGGMVIEPAEADLIRDAYARVIDGDTLASIMRDWNSAGVTSTTGKPWQYATLRQVLTRARNYGGSVHHGKVVGVGQWEPITDEATWRRANAILGDPKRRQSTSNTGRWLLAGLLICGKCGNVMRPANGSVRGGGRVVNYTCTGTGCFLSRQAEHTDKYITATVLARFLADDARELLVPPAAVDDTAAVQRDAEALRQRFEQSLELFREQVITADELKSLRADLTGRIAAAEAKLADPGRVQVFGELIEAADPLVLWESMTWRARRRVITALVTVTCLPVPAGVARRFSPDYLQVKWAG